MEASVVELKNKGMHQDFAISKTSDEFAFENLNIRITANDDRTLLAVTNEKSPSSVNVITHNVERTDNWLISVVYYKNQNPYIKVSFTKHSTQDINITLVRTTDTQSLDLTIPKGYQGYTLPFNPIFDTFGDLSFIADGNYRIDIKSDSRLDKNYVYLREGEDPSQFEHTVIEVTNIVGTYLGKALLNQYLVLFTVDDSYSYIWRINKEENDLNIKLLYFGNLKFNTNYPIEAISDYESENIQKVYWIDGFNPNRVINIANGTVYSDYDNQFDFVPEINIYPNVEIEKIYNGAGSFKSGVVQYYISYYNKYGSQSSIVYTSPLNYISLSDRGGKENETISVEFKLKITNFDKSFSNIRIYSAKRTSLDGPVEASIVGDYSIKDIDELTLTDLGTNQETIDPTLLFYISGDSFTAETLEKKDGVLFMGNINLTDNDLTKAEKTLIENTTIDRYELIDREFNLCTTELGKSNPDMGGYDVMFISFEKPVLSDVTVNLSIPVQAGHQTVTIPMTVVVPKKSSGTFILGYNTIGDAPYYLPGYDYFAYGATCGVTINQPRYDDTYIYVGSSENQQDYSEYEHEQKEKELLSNAIWESKVIGFNTKKVSKDFQLDADSSNIKGFKRGEVYRFAIQFQTDKGNWTSPVWIGDKKCNVAPETIDGELYIPTATFTWDNDIKQTLSNILKRYSNYRILIAETSTFTRSILAQGIVCPTMFNYGQRVDGTTFSFASYITRPKFSGIRSNHFDSTGANTDYNAEMQHISAAKPPCQEPDVILYDNDGTIVLADKWIIDIYYCYDFSIFGNPYKVQVAIAPAVKNGNSYQYEPNTYYIEMFETNVWNKLSNYVNVQKFVFDKTGIDIHSIGVEYDNTTVFDYSQTSVGNMILGGKMVAYTGSNGGIELIVDKTGVKAMSDVDKASHCFIDNSLLTLHSPELYYKTIDTLNKDASFRIVGIANVDTVKSDFLIDATSGRSPYAGYIGTSKQSKNATVADFIYQDDTESWKNCLFKMYMWHKQGSIIGQKELESGQNEYYSKLNHKIFANFSECGDTKYYSTEVIDSECTYDKSDSALFNSEENTVIKISSHFGDIYYCGNYDNLLYPSETGKYSIIAKYNGNTQVVSDEYTDPVRIKFKSTPHAVFSLDVDDSDINILPAFYNEDFWSLDKVYNNYVVKEGSDFAVASWVKNPSYRWGASGAVQEMTGLPIYGVIAIDTTDVQDLIDEVEEFFTGNFSSVNGMLLFKHSNETGIYYATGVHIYDTAIRQYVNEAAFGTKVGYFKYRYFGIGHNAIYLNNNTYSFESQKAYTQRKLPYIQGIDLAYPMIYIGELYRNIDYNTLYGGYSESALQALRWLPSSLPTSIGSNINTMEGDTYYQRFDCLKTYPWTEEDENSVVDVTSFMVETHINLDGRSDINRKGNILNIRPTNFNLRNPVYDQTNNMFVYNMLDERFDENSFKNQVVWSLTKTPTSVIDTWTKLNLANTLNLDANFGKLTKIIKNNDVLLAFQERGISTINFNNKVQIATEQGVPIELANSGKVDGYSIVTSHYGCVNKFTICKSKNGLYFIDSNKKLLVNISGEGVGEISTIGGMNIWFKENTSMDVWKPSINYYDSFAIGSFDDEPMEVLTPFVTFYDENTNDLYIANKSYCLVYNEYLKSFTSFMTDYIDVDFGVNLENKFYYLKHGKTSFKEMFGGDTYKADYAITYRVNAEPYIDKTFTNIEYIADVLEGKTIEPNIITDEGLKIPFTKLKVWNEHQEGTVNLEENTKLSNNIQKQRVWRDYIPRDKDNKRHRIKSPWIFLKLSHTGTAVKTIFHNLIVKYFK